MEWLIIAFGGIVVLMYAVIRLALALDALRRNPTLSEDLAATNVHRIDRSKDGQSNAPVEPDDAPDRGGE